MAHKVLVIGWELVIYIALVSLVCSARVLDVFVKGFRLLPTLHRIVWRIFWLFLPPFLLSSTNITANTAQVHAVHTDCFRCTQQLLNDLRLLRINVWLTKIEMYRTLNNYWQLWCKMPSYKCSVKLYIQKCYSKSFWKIQFLVNVHLFIWVKNTTENKTPNCNDLLCVDLALWLGSISFKKNQNTTHFKFSVTVHQFCCLKCPGISKTS